MHQQSKLFMIDYIWFVHLFNLEPFKFGATFFLSRAESISINLRICDRINEDCDRINEDNFKIDGTKSGFVFPGDSDDAIEILT